MSKRIMAWRIQDTVSVGNDLCFKDELNQASQATDEIAIVTDDLFSIADSSGCAVVDGILTD